MLNHSRGGCAHEDDGTEAGESGDGVHGRVAAGVRGLVGAGSDGAEACLLGMLSRCVSVKRCGAAGLRGEQPPLRLAVLVGGAPRVTPARDFPGSRLPRRRMPGGASLAPKPAEVAATRSSRPDGDPRGPVRPLRSRNASHFPAPAHSKLNFQCLSGD